MRRAGRGETIYAVVLLIAMVAVALLSPYPFSMIAWAVAAVAALFLVLGVVLPFVRG